MNNLSEMVCSHFYLKIKKKLLEMVDLLQCGNGHAYFTSRHTVLRSDQ
jgi:hypothetical protein